MHAGENLKELRSRLGITLRQVEEESQKIATAHGNPEFLVSNHWLTRLENTNSVPSIFKLFSLSAIYRINFSELSSFSVSIWIYWRNINWTPQRSGHI